VVAVDQDFITAPLNRDRCTVIATEQIDDGRPLIVFGKPLKVRHLSNRPILLVSGAVLASERYLLPNVYFVSSGPIVTSGKTLAASGRLMTATVWRSTRWACIVPRPHEQVLPAPSPQGYCVRDTNGDGKADRVWDGTAERQMEPVALTPVKRVGPDRATRVRLVLVAGRVRGTFTVRGETRIITSTSLTDYEMRTGNEGPWSRRFRPANGRTFDLDGIKLSLSYRKGRWWIRPSGRFRAPMLCKGATAVSIGGVTIYSANPDNASPG
jgi:hypothetical protein